MTEYRRSQFAVLSRSSLARQGGEPGVYRLAANTRHGTITVVDEATGEDLVSEATDWDEHPMTDDLLKSGLLVPSHADEAAEILKENQKAIREDGAVRATIMPSAFCNLGCGYCGQEHIQRTWDAGKTVKIAERLLRQARSRQATAVSVRWFGGEPLMGLAAIRRFSKIMLDALDDMGIPYHAGIVTNGTLLSPRVAKELITKWRVSQFEITLDGPKETHDLLRPDKQGRINYDRIISNLQGLVDEPWSADASITIRTNVSEQISDRHDEFAQAMAGAGLAGRRNVNFYPATVHAWGNDVSEFKVDAKRYADTQLRWLDAMRRFGLTSSTRPPMARKRIVCVAVTGGDVIDPGGGVFSCTEHPLVPPLQTLNRLGDISSTPLERPAGLFGDWNTELLNNSGPSPCRGCELLPVCGGSCPKAWHDGNPPCPPLKFNLPDRLDIYAESMGLYPAEQLPA